MSLKIEPSEITSFFYSNFSHFGGTFHVFPLGAYASDVLLRFLMLVQLLFLLNRLKPWKKCIYPGKMPFPLALQPLIEWILAILSDARFLSAVLTKHGFKTEPGLVKTDSGFKTSHIHERCFMYTHFGSNIGCMLNQFCAKIWFCN